MAMYPNLEPISQELLVIWCDYKSEYSWVPDSLGVPRFSKVLFNGLRPLFHDDEAVLMLEFVTRFKDFGAADDLSELRKAVSKRLKTNGVRLPRGKRTNPGLEKLVEELTPLMRYFGLPLATSERSRLVVALRMIADEYGIKGDPRDELRRLLKIEKSLQSKSRKAF